jgi:SNF2 family DNA or RNA helicase
MLTGTPVFNYGDEIWNLMSFVRPEVLGERDDFYREWCGTARR